MRRGARPLVAPGGSSKVPQSGRRGPGRAPLRPNTVHLQGNMVGQTISLCRLPGSGRDRPRKAMVCPTKCTVLHLGHRPPHPREGSGGSSGQE
jgi:hypothetical protein